MKQTDKPFITTIIAMTSITILGSVYLFMGHNSIGFTAMIGVLCGLAGYALPSPLQRNKIFK